MGLRQAVENRVSRAQEPQDGLGMFLRCSSWFYQGAVRLRNRFYDKGLGLRRLPAPVLSVGNLTVGGTGKTPLVIFLASFFRDRGLKVTVLSRGHKRERTSRVLEVSRGQGSLVSIRQAGDEPYMMAQKLQGVSVWVGADRFRAGMAAWEKAPSDLFVLDDGFQHRALIRDLDLVVARLPRPWGNNRLIPAGPLREPLSSLRRAQLVVLTGKHTGGVPAQWIQAAPGIPMLRAFLRAKTLRPMGGEELYPAEFLRGKRVALVCAIGHPDGFRELVMDLGAELGPCLFFPDHHWYTPRDAVRIRSLAQEVSLILTTEKDLWKLRETGVELPGLMVLEAELEVENRGILEALLESRSLRTRDPA